MVSQSDGAVALDAIEGLAPEDLDRTVGIGESKKGIVPGSSLPSRYRQ